MPFQVICLKNKVFWNKVLTTFAGFLAIVIVFAVVFPIKHNTTNAASDLADATIVAAQTEQDENETNDTK